MNIKKYVILYTICASAFPAFAQQGSIAGKVIRSIASKRAIIPQVKVVALPQVRPVVFTEDVATPYLFMADDLYKKASFANRFTPQTNLTKLGVRGPVSAIERFTHENPVKASAAEKPTSLSGRGKILWPEFSMVFTAQGMATPCVV